MKRLPFLLLLVLAALASRAQAPAEDRWMANDGTVDFRSEAPLELIEARSSDLRGVLGTDGRFAFALAMNSFEGFNSGLQKEHFRENYLETERFPRATFEGRLIDPPAWPLEAPEDVRVRGELTVHGVSRERILPVRLEPDGEGGIAARSTFLIRLDDHDIGIPRIMHQKIAETIEVDVRVRLRTRP
jgi:hypothetical protein